MKTVQCTTAALRQCSSLFVVLHEGLRVTLISRGPPDQSTDCCNTVGEDGARRQDCSLHALVRLCMLGIRGAEDGEGGGRLAAHGRHGEVHLFQLLDGMLKVALRE